MKIVSLVVALAALLAPATATAATTADHSSAHHSSAHHFSAHHFSAHHFKNCTDMHKTYKGGVARKGARDHRSGGGHARYAPHVSTALYKANSGMDRDRDGIACEQ